jgi:hypothetical protein
VSALEGREHERTDGQLAGAECHPKLKLLPAVVAQRVDHDPSLLLCVTPTCAAAGDAS